jgi:glycosyltransferase involved in cell wall biosynthesis
VESRGERVGTGMKVLMISKGLVVGAYHGKLRELSKLGVELTVVVPPRWGRQELEKVEPDEYELLVNDCRFSGSHHFHYYPAISSVVGREAWDLIHIEEEAFNVVTYHALRACLRRGRKVIFFSWQNLYKTYPPPFNYFERFSLKHVQAAIAGTEEVREVLSAKGFCKPITVIPQFGVDPEFFQKRDATDLKRRLGLAGKFAIGYVGRIVREKGIADLIRALVSLPERCVLVLVGGGEFERPLRKLSESLGMVFRIRWVSHISSLEVPEYMNAFDVLVLPSRTTSRWKEQFGRVLIEAMSCETPVIGSSSAEIPRVIGEAGLVFPEGDVAALSGELQRLHDDPSLALDLGAKGRARVLEKFTHRRIAVETLRAYEQVVTGPRSAHSGIPKGWDSADGMPKVANGRIH